MCNYEPSLLMIGWPQVGPQKPDRAMVRALLGMYAGSRGELTAIAQYMYQNLLCSAAGWIDLGDLFGAAARDSMFHLKRLGHLIVQYGGDPRFLSYPNGRPVWWSPGAVSYQSDPCTMLRDAIEGKRRSIHEYRQIEARMEPEPRALIQRILLNETYYLDLFQCMLHEMDCESKPVS